MRNISESHFQFVNIKHKNSFRKSIFQHFSKYSLKVYKSIFEEFKIMLYKLVRNRLKNSKIELITNTEIKQDSSE